MADEDGVVARQRMRAAMEAHDHAAVASLFADDVVLHSPIISSPFVGKRAVSDLYAAIIDRFRDYRYTREMEGDGEQLLAMEGTLRGRPLQGVIALRVNDEGLISEVTVIIRPLAGVIAFLVELGPPLARRKSRLHALVLRLISPPLPLVARLVEWVAPKMIDQGRR
jgi:SnoaL-like domain